MDIKFNNPLSESWYADPEARFYEGKYCIYVTRSLPYDEQLNHDMFVSDDLEHWKKALDIFDCRDSDENKIGFQYVDFFIEGEDILMLSRTAFNGAANYHDANYSVFHKIEDFRSYLN